MRRLLAATVLFAAACNGSGSAEGKVSNQELDVSSAWLVKTQQGPAQSTMIVLSSESTFCDDTQKGISRKGHGALYLQLGSPGGQLSNGTYEVVGNTSSSMQATAMFVKFEDDSCSAATGAEGVATSGRVEIESFDEDYAVVGSFDLEFPDGELEGEFDARFCFATPDDDASLTSGDCE